MLANGDRSLTPNLATVPKLLEMAENEARNRKCRGAWLETLSTDACRFYQRQGYRLFGVIEDKPPGNSHSLLSKRFSA